MKRMFIITVSVFLLLAMSITAFADSETEVWWGSNYMPGNLVLEANISYETIASSAPGVGIYPEVEYIIYKPYIGTISPIDIGAAVRGRIGFALGDFESPLSIGLGAFATVHFSMKGLGFIPDISDNIEVFSELGVAFDIVKHESVYRALGFASKSGIAYHLNDAIAVKFGYVSWVNSSGPFIGGHIKFGPGQEVVPKTLVVSAPKAKAITMPTMPYAQMYLSQFYALYWYVFAAGGYFFDDSTYKQGQGTVWSITSVDSEDEEMFVERALLSIQPDGSKWWKMRFYDDDGTDLLYEVKTDPGFRVVMFRFKDTSEDQSGEYTLTPDEVESMNPQEMSVITREDYKDWIQGKEKITTPAGTYNTDYVKTSYSDGQYDWSYNWWVAEKVPGGLVKFRWDNSDDDWYQGELIEITSGNKAELGSLE